MKKIVTLLLLAFFIGGNFSRAAGASCGAGLLPCPTGEYCFQIGTNLGTCTTSPGGGNNNTSTMCGGAPACTDGKVCINNICSAPTGSDECNSCRELSSTTDLAAGCTADTEEQKSCGGKIYCCPVDPCNGMGTRNATTQTCGDPNALADDETVMGMTIGPKCLLNGQCKFNIYDALGIRTSVRNQGDPTSVGIFVQDIVLSATMFIGTIVTIAIIVSGLMRIMAGASGKDPTKAKSGLINALIGLLIVVSSYLIIRLVQYIAKGV